MRICSKRCGGYFNCAIEQFTASPKSNGNATGRDLASQKQKPNSDVRFWCSGTRGRFEFGGIARRRLPLHNEHQGAPYFMFNQTSSSSCTCAEEVY